MLTCVIPEPTFMAGVNFFQKPSSIPFKTFRHPSSNHQLKKDLHKVDRGRSISMENKRSFRSTTTFTRLKKKKKKIGKIKKKNYYLVPAIFVFQYPLAFWAGHRCPVLVNHNNRQESRQEIPYFDIRTTSISKPSTPELSISKNNDRSFPNKSFFS